MTGQVIKKVVQKLKRPTKEWYFNATSEMLQRFHFLLGHASAFDYSQCEYLLFGRQRGKYDRTDRETAWRNFQNEIELNFGRIDNDSCSTLATMDDNPGTGRLVDKFVYQPIGRSIERLFLNLEISYFHPPEKSACQIKRFLEGTEYFGNLIPVDISQDSLDYYLNDRDTVDLYKVCISFFLEISRKEKIVKAFHRLLMQASSKHRGLRVEAQKQIWSLFRYERMPFILNAITDLKSLIWDGYTTTFQHCSPLDLDFQTHFKFTLDMIALEDEALVDISATLCISMKNILETCARENRGFSSLPINLVLKLLVEELDAYVDHRDQKFEDNEKFAENLYLASIAIIGFCNEFPYALDSFIVHLRAWCNRRCGSGRKPSNFFPSMWGKDRTELDIKELELMAHFMINLINADPAIRWKAGDELRYYIALLNDADKAQGKMSYLEARASEEYLRKVTEVLVQRASSFAMFKDTVTNPLIWEKYYRPERQTEATWNYELRIDIVSYDESLKSVPLCFYYIPFSDSFRSEDFRNLYFSLDRSSCWRPYYKDLIDGCFQIQEWLEELKDDSIELHWDRPGTWLNKVMKWWWSDDVQKVIARRNQEIKDGTLWMRVQKTKMLLKLWGFSAEIISMAMREDESVAIPPAFTSFTSPSPGFEAGLAQTEVEREPASTEEHFLPHQTEDGSSQHRRQHIIATESSPLPSRYGRLKRKFGEEEPRPQIAPLPRRYRDNTAVYTEPGSSLGPARKKQKTSLSLESDASDADAIITEVDEYSTKSDTGSEDAMSVDEDFRSAKSKLSLLAIED